MSTSDRDMGIEGGSPKRTTETTPQSTPQSQDLQHLTADPVRWSAVWAGLMVALSVFVLLEMLFFTFGWLTMEAGDRGAGAGVVTAILGLVAFLIGGFVAGTGSIWFGAREGMLHGILVWALGVVGILLLSMLGAGALFGVASNVFSDLSDMWQGGVSDEEISQALQSAESGVGWASLGLIVYLLAAAGGGVAGVKTGAARRQAREREVTR